MRSVLFIGPLPEPTTGQSLACQVLLDALLREGYRVEVVNLSKSDFRQGVSSLARIREVLGFIWHIWRRRKAHDVIYLTVAESIAGNVKDLLFYLACFRQSRRVVIHLHGGAGLRKIMLATGWLQKLNAALVRRLGGAIVLGQRHVEIFEKSVEPQRIFVVPNFAPDDLFAPQATIERKFSRVHPLRLLLLSNLLPGKGYQELLSAYLTLPADVQAAIEMDFAGGFESAQHRDEFLARIQGLERVRYHGQVRGEKKRQLFLDAHVFCLPTYYPYEGQPISILEAYAAGCAVITTDHSGIFDVFADGANGLAVTKQSVGSLRAAIERALAAPQELRRMGIANRETADRLYRASTHTERLISVLRQVSADAGRA